MGNEHSNQRGFFLAVVVLVGVALLASYFNAGAEGNVVVRRPVSTLQNVQAQQSNVLLPSLSLDELDTPQNAQGSTGCDAYSHVCTHEGILGGTGAGKTEKEAQNAALADCKTKVLAAKEEINKCLAELAKKMLTCVSDPYCEVGRILNVDTLSPQACYIRSCMNRVLVDDSKEIIICEYTYNSDGTRIEPGKCSRHKVIIDIPLSNWRCGASDGYAHYTLQCREKE